MKKYKCEQCMDRDGDPMPDCIDLVNVNDKDDRIMANPDDFIVGKTYDESEFHLEERNYTYEDGYGTAPFAFMNDTIAKQK